MMHEQFIPKREAWSDCAATQDIKLRVVLNLLRTYILLQSNERNLKCVLSLQFESSQSTKVHVIDNIRLSGCLGNNCHIYSTWLCQRCPFFYESIKHAINHFMVCFQMLLEKALHTTNFIMTSNLSDPLLFHIYFSSF